MGKGNPTAHLLVTAPLASSKQTVGLLEMFATSQLPSGSSARLPSLPRAHDQADRECFKAILCSRYRLVKKCGNMPIICTAGSRQS